MKKITQGQKLHSILLLAMLLFAYMVLGQDYDPDEKRTYQNSTIGKSFDVEYKGKITLSDDDRDITAISPGGFIEISKTTFGNRRYVLIEAESGGKLFREYREGRTVRDWDPYGAEWLAEILPELVRSTTIAMDSRIARFYKKGGTGAVLNEMEKLEGDYVQSKYFNHFLSEYDLRNDDIARVAKAAGDLIGSDYYLSEVLKNNGKLFFASENATNAYIEAAREIGSDYYLSVVLKEAMENKDLSASQMDQLIKASSYISSDYYMTMVLKQVLEQDNLSPATLKTVISQSRSISSDHYQSELIKEIIDKDDLEGENIDIIIDALSNVGSDYYIYTVLLRILDRNDLTEKSTLNIARRVMDEISSDHYASEVLSKLSEKRLSDEGFKALIEAGGRVDSDFYNSKLLKSISERKLSENQLLMVLEGSKNVSSDFYQSEVLISLASQVNNSTARVKEAYSDAADGISSQTYYGKVMKALRD